MFKEFFVGLNFSCANSFGNYEEIAYGSVNNEVFTFLNNKNEFIFVTGERHTLSNEVIMFGLMEAPNFPKTEKSAAESLLLLQLEYDLQLEKIEAGIINPPISKRTILWSKGEKNNMQKFPPYKPWFSK